ncbi:SRPBCC family protein [Azospirillum sp. ST 5-10]|uniref:SRPBCC family protein n=1 Tax=unclassified Azospirillum TaxID=2630922 RepID=UPI003F4A6818
MPQITQSFTVAFPRARVWPLLGDVAQVVPCMPGASLTAPVEDGAFAGQMRVKLGPIAAAFAGQGTLTLDEAGHSGTIQGQGTDAKSNSRAKGTVTFTVAEAEEGRATRVDLAVDFTLSGMLAQFSRGAIVQEIAQRLTAEFARNLEATLAAVTPDATPDATPAAAAAPVRELNGGALLWAMLRDWIKGLLAGARRRAPLG